MKLIMISFDDGANDCTYDYVLEGTVEEADTIVDAYNKTYHLSGGRGGHRVTHYAAWRFLEPLTAEQLRKEMGLK